MAERPAGKSSIPLATLAEREPAIYRVAAIIPIFEKLLGTGAVEITRCRMLVPVSAWVVLVVRSPVLAPPPILALQIVRFDFVDAHPEVRPMLHCENRRMPSDPPSSGA
jgi:hypothetical protein